MQPTFKDITGQRFGRLVAVSYERERRGTSKRLRTYWNCRCDCGKLTRLVGQSLRKSKRPTISCGCLKHDTAPKFEHGEAIPGEETPEYFVWRGMIGRCRYPSHSSFANYGGRGIAVCERWQRGDGVRGGYVCFIADMGRRPSADHQIDRIDNDGNYEPGNCRWATRSAQNKNRRPRRNLKQ